MFSTIRGRQSLKEPRQSTAAMETVTQDKSMEGIEAEDASKVSVGDGQERRRDREDQDEQRASIGVLGLLSKRKTGSSAGDDTKEMKLALGGMSVKKAKRMHMILQYMEEHRVITNLTDLFKVWGGSGSGM